MTDRTTNFQTKIILPLKPTPAAALALQMDLLMQRLVLPHLPDLAGKLDLNPADGHLITFLHLHGATPMTALAQAHHLPLSTTTHRIDKLVKAKLVSRRRSLEDRRRVDATLTAKGTSLANSLAQMRLDVATRMLVPLTATERQTLLKLLTKINSI